MPVISEANKVLVTGGNGYIAMHWLPNVHKVFAEHREKLELVVVPDLAKEGAFDEAVRASQGVKVYGSNFTNYCGKIIQEPAVNGTIGLLKSAARYGNEVKRIVITPSIVAIVQMDFRAPAGVHTEEIWNESSAKEAESGSQNTLTMYCASKTLAEKAAWDFHSQYKDEIKWDLSVVNPTVVFANPLQELGSPQDLSETMEYWWYHVICEVPKTDEQLGSGSGWVDVRDVADAHVLALEKEEAGGERFLITADSFIWQDWIDIANQFDPISPAEAASRITRSREGKQPHI
ncbi:D-lactaldehyde dehydrogenase [Coprinopsis sp. MPI-PUGE-AT-0042]|nr:D-lactaldehyde dehydrogenase [Coprinopsis sp. MPI-PUGE-AT-0042]